MSPEHCIPADKHDLAAVARAEAMGFPALNPVIPDLVGCLQDINWPIAPRIALLLQQAGGALIAPAALVLRGDDGMWKYWVIHHVLMHLDPQVRAPLTADLVRLADHPTADDRDCEADLAAAELLGRS